MGTRTMGLPGRLGSHAGAEAYLLDGGEQHQGLDDDLLEECAASKKKRNLVSSAFDVLGNLG